ncbi:helix-turn-helix domain-containing protein [Streptomyces sp. NBC_01511]|uniref:helix-turn-helix domain-containing protein n=1 Tax=Streptomyces sp. NBC_01511 TaxID=2903889 RepID=UPI00386D3C76
MTTGQHDPTTEGPTPDGEDLPALLLRLLAETGRDQKELADATGITYSRLNNWLTRTRGTSRIDAEDLRALAVALQRWGAKVTPRQVFAANGRPTPGPAVEERERKLIDIYRSLPVQGQRALIQHAELLRGTMALGK